MVTGLEQRGSNVRFTTREAFGRLASLSRHDAIGLLGADRAVAASSVVADAFSPTMVERNSIRQLLIYRLNGVLSIIFVTDCETDGDAFKKADAIAKLGYRVEVWRDGAEIQC